MTEVEWLSTPPSMLRMVKYCASLGHERKLRLFLYACCCRIKHAFVDHRSRLALEGFEKYIEGQPDQMKLLSLRSLALAAVDGVLGPVGLDVDDLTDPTPGLEAADAVVCLTNPSLATTWDGENPPLHLAAFHASCVFSSAVYHRTWKLDESRAGRAAEAQAVRATEALVQASFLRDIFGNPFRPIPFTAAWRTESAVGIAAQMYETRDYSAMPILADALEEAGCDNADILAHCRGPGAHVRGCWIVDLLTGGR